MHPSAALLVAGGVAGFLVGDLLFRRALALGTLRTGLWRFPPTLAAAPAGTRVGGYAEVGRIVAVLVSAFALESGGAAAPA